MRRNVTSYQFGCGCADRAALPVALHLSQTSCRLRQRVRHGAPLGTLLRVLPGRAARSQSNRDVSEYRECLIQPAGRIDQQLIVSEKANIDRENRGTPDIPPLLPNPIISNYLFRIFPSEPRPHRIFLPKYRRFLLRASTGWFTEARGHRRLSPVLPLTHSNDADPTSCLRWSVCASCGRIPRGK